MADLGNLFFSLRIKDMTEEDLKKIEKRLSSKGVSVETVAKTTHFIKSLREKLKGQSVDVAINPLTKKSSMRKVEMDVNKTYLQKSVRAALSGQEFKANLKLVVNKASVNDAIKQAFAKAGMNYNTSASDVRNQRILDIQARMAERAAIAQQRLANAQAAGARSADRHNASMQRGNSLMQSQGRIAGQLKNQLLDLYSIYSMERFVRSLIEVGGEFQKQHIALKTMLGDVGKADALFGQIKELAIESPFNFRELMGFTKQIAAFGIPYEEMYETTKRLADISAGLGVDMGRIILAYGQVRSAAFLRGQELRQFTEAGIPLVDELAKKFTELEGNVVSAGEVFDKISRREVSFGMVKDVLWEFTEEGGKFYNMQEVLTESLSGKLAKLKDSYEMMLGSIADSNNAILGGGLDMLTELTNSWKGFANIMLSVVAAYGTYKVTMFSINALSAVHIIHQKGIAKAAAIATKSLAAQSASMRIMSAQTSVMITKVNRLKTALSGLGKAGWIGIILSVLAAIGTYLYNAYQDSSRLRNKLDDIFAEASQSANDATREFKSLVDQLEYTVKGSNEYNDIVNKIQSRYGDYLGNIQKEAYSYALLSDKIGDVTLALREKAAEEARQKGKSEIKEEYAGDLSSWRNKLEERLIGELGVSKSVSKSIVLSFINSIEDAFASGESVNYGELMNSLLEKGGLDKIDFKYAFSHWGSAANAAYELSSVIRKVHKSTTDFENTLKSLSTTDFGKKIEEIDRLWEEEKKTIPEKSISRMRYAYLKVLETKKKVYEDAGQTEEVKRIETEIAEVSRLTAEWKEVAKEKLSAYPDLLPKDETSSDYINSLRKQYKDLKNITKDSIDTGEKDHANRKLGAIRSYFSHYGVSTEEQSGSNSTQNDVEDAEKKLNEKLLELHARNQKEYVALMRDGRRKKLNEIEADYEAQKAKIDKEEKELLKLSQKAKKGDTLSSEQQAKINMARKLNEQTRDKKKNDLYRDDLEAMNEYLKEYGTFEEKKLAIRKEYEDKIREADSVGSRMSLKAQMDQELSKLDFEQFKSGLNWEDIFGNLGELNVAQLKNIRDQLRSIVAEGKLGMDEYQTVVERINALNEAIVNGQDSIRSAFGLILPMAQQQKLLEMQKAEIIARQNELIIIQGGLQGVMWSQQQGLSYKLGSLGISVKPNELNPSSANGVLKTVGDKYGYDSDVYTEIQDAFSQLADTTRELNDVNQRQVQLLSDKMGVEGKQKKTLDDFQNKISGASNMMSLINGNMQSLPDLFEQLGVDMSGSFGEGINDMAETSQAATNMMQNAMSGNIVGAVSEGIKAVKGTLSSFNNLLGLGIGKGNAEETAKKIAALTASNEALRTSIDGLKDKLDNVNGSKALSYYNQLIAAQKKYEENQRQILDADMRYTHAHGSNAKYWNLNRGTLNSINSLLGTNLRNTWDDFMRLTADQMNDIRTHLPEAWSEMINQGKYGSRFEDDWNAYADLAGRLDEYTQGLYENLTQISFDGLRDSFVDSLMDMNRSAEDFANDFKGYMTRALLNFAIGDQMDAKMKNWYESWAKTMQNQNGELTKSQINKFRTEWERFVKEGLAVRDSIADITQYEGDESSSSGGLSKGIQSVTEDTAGLLASYINAIRADVSIKRMLLERFFNDDFVQLSATVQAQLQKLDMIVANTGRNADIAQDIYDILHRNVNGMNKFHL